MKLIFGLLVALMLGACGSAHAQSVTRICVQPVPGGAFNCQDISTLNPMPTAPYANSSFATSQVSVGASATPIVAARSGRGSVTIENTGTTVIYIGNSAVTTGTGFYLPGVAGAAVTIPSSAALYGITAGGSQTVTVVETF